MIGHDHYRVQIDSLPMFAQAVVENQLASFGRQRQARPAAESDKEGRIRLLQVRKASPVAILRDLRSWWAL